MENNSVNKKDDYSATAAQSNQSINQRLHSCSLRYRTQWSDEQSLIIYRVTL